MHHDSTLDSKHDERSRRGDPPLGGWGSLAEPPPRIRSPSKRRTAHREHTRGIQPEPEPEEECLSDDSFKQPKKDRSMKTRTECRITTPSSPTEDRVLNSGPLSRRAGYYEQGDLYPPLDTASRVSTRHGSRYDGYYVSTRHDQYANPVPLRNPEPDYVPPPLRERAHHYVPAQYGVPLRNPEPKYVPPRQIEGADRHHRLLEAPSGSGRRRPRH